MPSRKLISYAKEAVVFGILLLLFLFMLEQNMQL